MKSQKLCKTSEGGSRGGLREESNSAGKFMEDVCVLDLVFADCWEGTVRSS